MLPIAGDDLFFSVLHVPGEPADVVAGEGPGRRGIAARVDANETAGPLWNSILKVIPEDPSRKLVIHNLLSHLADQMVRINRQKQQACHRKSLHHRGLTRLPGSGR